MHGRVEANPCHVLHQRARNVVVPCVHGQTHHRHRGLTQQHWLRARQLRPPEAFPGCRSAPQEHRELVQESGLSKARRAQQI